MIEVRNLKKTYNVKGNITKALDDVTIKFPETGMVFLLGKSGSGKSTLLNICGGLDEADSGEVIIMEKALLLFLKVILIHIEIHMLDSFSKNIIF